MPVILNTTDYGVPKRTLIEMAFVGVGLASFDFDRTGDEVTSALTRLNSMMKEWPWTLVDYNHPDYGIGLPEESSNVPGDAESAIADELALRIAPGLGLSLSPEQRVVRASTRAAFLAAYATIPTVELRTDTVAGSGARRRLAFLQ